MPVGGTAVHTSAKLLLRLPKLRSSFVRGVFTGNPQLSPDILSYRAPVSAAERL